MRKLTRQELKLQRRMGAREVAAGLDAAAFADAPGEAVTEEPAAAAEAKVVCGAFGYEPPRLEPELSASDRWLLEWFEIARKDEEVRQVLDMVLYAGREEVARGLRKGIEQFYERYLSEAEPEDQALQRPYLLLSGGKQKDQRAGASPAPGDAV